ncbi:asparaginyl-tRNA synthetase 1, partial [Homo sapiens]
MVLAELYVSDREGSDATGDGTKEKPFKTGLKALMTVGKEPFPTIYVDSQKENERWNVISKSQLKNIKKMWHREQMKSESREKKEVKIGALEGYRGQRVKVFGWVHRLRRQGKNLMFLVLRDGTGYLQCVLADELCQCYNGVLLSTESSVAVYGMLNLTPKGKQAPGG